MWHIHGEIDNGYDPKNITQYAAASIMSGHEHYGDYFRRIHQYLRPFSTDEGTKKKIVKNQNWVNLFFTHNIHIAGLTLDSSEFHLWWLLAYRARLKEKYRNIKNKIIFHCASYDYKSDNAKAVARLDLLKSFGVQIEQKTIIEDSNKKYQVYWDDFFKDVNELIKKT